MRRIVIVSMVVILLALHASVSGTPAQASVPTRVPFQGLLLDSGGTPVTGVVSLEFELFDALLAGASLWSESHPGIAVVDGVYSVDLGATNPLGAEVFTDGTAFLEITVDGETLVPRQQMLAVPYAAVAEEAKRVAGVPETVLASLWEHVNYDGGGPPNDDPEEGVADVDGDGIPNFLDPDNDGDSVSDIDEVANGTPINLVSPGITGTTPSTLRVFEDTSLSVAGFNLGTLTSVTLDGAPITPSNATASGFDLSFPFYTGPGTATIEVTIANGQSTTEIVPVLSIPPTLVEVIPRTGRVGIPITITLTGDDFRSDSTVTIEGQSESFTFVDATELTLSTTPTIEGPNTIEVTNPDGTSDVFEWPVRPVSSHIMFVTSGVYAADFGSIEAADAICQAEADAGSLGGAFKAWLSRAPGSTPPYSPAADLSSNPEGPYILPGIDGGVPGVRVADDWADLTDGSLDEPVGITAIGSVAQVFFTWTGTLDDGTAWTNTCGDWTDTTARGAVGYTGGSGPNWTVTNGAGFCDDVKRFYCIEQ